MNGIEYLVCAVLVGPQLIKGLHQLIVLKNITNNTFLDFNI